MQAFCCNPPDVGQRKQGENRTCGNDVRFHGFFSRKKLGYRTSPFKPNFSQVGRGSKLSARAEFPKGDRIEWPSANGAVSPTTEKGTRTPTA
jgi:hypothetical protein